MKTVIKIYSLIIIMTCFGTVAGSLGILNNSGESAIITLYMHGGEASQEIPNRAMALFNTSHSNFIPGDHVTAEIGKRIFLYNLQTGEENKRLQLTSTSLS